MEYKDATDIIAGLRVILDWTERKIAGTWVTRVFWHTVRVKWYTPPALLGHSWELDPPNRKSRVIMLRYWWDQCLVLGFWGKTHYDEGEALLNATLFGRERTDDERAGYDDARAYDLADPSTEAFSSSFLHGRSELRIRATSDAGLDG